VTIHEAIRQAEALLPGEPVEEGGDPRWQAIIAIGGHVEAEPEAVWSFIERWGGHPQQDLRAAVACCLLEHLLEYHFAAYLPRVERRALADPRFGAMFLICSRFGQTEEPAHSRRFESLQRRLLARGDGRGLDR
jgi:hypothetical protein